MRAARITYWRYHARQRATMHWHGPIYQRASFGFAPWIRRALEVNYQPYRVIDKTVTGAGARLLSDRLARPLVSVTDINARLDAVSFFIAQTQLRGTIIDTLKSIGDMARAISRLALGRGGPRDLQLIGAALLA